MKWIRYLSVALENIKAHKLRSILTMLGIIIGVASTQTTIGLGSGLKRDMEEKISQMGVNSVIIAPKVKKAGELSSLTMGDAKALSNREVHPEIARVAPVNLFAIQVVNDRNVVEGQVWGTTPEYTLIRNLKVSQGQFFQAEDVAAQRHVVVLSALAATELFKDTGVSPVGQKIRIKNSPFTVVGVLSKGKEDQGSASEKPIYVPVSVAQNYLVDTPRRQGEYIISTLVIQVIQKDLIQSAAEQIEKTLRLGHNLRFGKENDFYILTQDDMQKQADAIAAIITAFLGSIGAISLLVGGIGIMNIMLVVVAERTREIGLRKALGAQNSDIRLQFLIEALVLCALGSLLGIALSYGISLGLHQIKDANGDPKVKVVIEFGTLLLGLSVGLISGLVFGIYPAVKATRLSPIEALRYE